MNQEIDSSQINLFVERDKNQYVRFNARILTAFKWLNFVYLALIVLHALLGTSITFTYANMLMYCITHILVFIETDAILYFIATNVAWLYSFSTYVYSTASLRLADDKLYGADQSVLIATVYFAACVTAYLLYKSIKKGGMRLPDAAAYFEFSGMIEKRAVFVFLGLTVLVFDAFIHSGATASLARQFTVLLWLGIGLRYMGNRILKIDGYIIALSAIFFMISSLFASRAMLLAPLASFLCIYVYQCDRVNMFPLRKWIAALVIINCVSLFSAIALDLRLNSGSEGKSDYISGFFDKIADPDNIISLVNPFHTSKSGQAVNDYMVLETFRDRFQIPYFSSLDSIATRFTNLPLLDVVCGIYSYDRIKLDEIQNILLSVLPNVGQEKDLIYSDRLTWDLGLRDVDNIGRPDITNACELFTLAGWGGLYLIAFIEFFIFITFIGVLKKQLRFPILWASVLPQIVIWMTVTTTALSVVAYLIRTIPMTIFVIWLAKYYMNRRPRMISDGVKEDQYAG
jgi:hypothetical protein